MINTAKDSSITYERIADITSMMLKAARAKDWPKITELEALCAIEIEKITSAKPEPITGEALQSKIASIHKILAHDREIRDLLSPWMLRMDALFSGKTKPMPYQLNKPSS